MVDTWKQLRKTVRIHDIQTNRDLATDLLDTGFLQIYKVKAHNERHLRSQTLDPKLRWATEGNTAADLAAKSARGRELPLLLTVSDTVAGHGGRTLLASARLPSPFLQYLIDLSLAEAKFRAAVAQDRLDEVDEEKVTEYSSLPEHWSSQGGCQQPQFMPLESLALQLKWPALPVTSTHELGVTYLWSKSLPPVLIYNSKEVRYVSHAETSTWLQPNSIHACIGSFHAALLKFRQLYHVDLVLGPARKGLIHLRLGWRHRNQACIFDQSFLQRQAGSIFYAPSVSTPM